MECVFHNKRPTQIISFVVFIKYNATRPMDKKLRTVLQRHEGKFLAFLKEHCLLTGIKDSPNNITGDHLTPEEEHVLRFGLKHGLATRLKESDVIVSAESVWDQLKQQNLIPDSYIKQQKIKNSIKALACNFFDFDTRKMASDSIHTKTLKNLSQRYAIFKPDKGNRVVLMKLTDYVTCMTSLFADRKKFKKLQTDPSFALLSYLQNYL